METEIFKNIALVAGIGGIALLVFLQLFKEFIRTKVFSQVSAKDTAKILNRFLILVFIVTIIALALHVLLVLLNKPEKNVENIEKFESGLTYEYSCKEKSNLSKEHLSKTTKISSRFSDLSDKFDKNLEKSIFDITLIRELENLLNDSNQSYISISESKNKNFNNLLWLKNVAITGLNYRLAYLYTLEMDTINVIKYSTQAIKASDGGKDLLKNKNSLSEECRINHDQWMSREKHLDRFNLYRLFSLALDYDYNPNTKTNISEFKNVTKNISSNFIKERYKESEIKSYSSIIKLINGGIISDDKFPLNNKENT